MAGALPSRATAFVSKAGADEDVHDACGNAGSHAQYIRVPFADVGAFRIPDEVSYERALFASVSVSTG